VGRYASGVVAVLLIAAGLTRRFVIAPLGPRRAAAFFGADQLLPGRLVGRGRRSGVVATELTTADIRIAL